MSAVVRNGFEDRFLKDDGTTFSDAQFSRRQSRVETYGNSWERYVEYGNKIGWVCESCQIKIKALSCSKDKIPSARNDHDKHTGKFRGLTCDPCNLCLGWVEKIAQQSGKTAVEVCGGLSAYYQRPIADVAPFGNAKLLEQQSERNKQRNSNQYMNGQQKRKSEESEEGPAKKRHCTEPKQSPTPAQSQSSNGYDYFKEIEEKRKELNQQRYLLQVIDAKINLLRKQRKDLEDKL